MDDEEVYMNSVFDQGNQRSEQQINVAGNLYHYNADSYRRHQSTSRPLNRPPVLHNLPQRDYAQFVGRATELQKIRQILRPYPHSQHAFVTIDGIGGMGKSTLALEVAHLFLDQYDNLPSSERFEAIVWTSAKERTLTGDGVRPRYQTHRKLDDLYRAIAITLQREDIAKAVTEQQAALLHNELIQQRTLIIVDNLETIDDEAVINFIRELPAPTKVVVTTRHRIDVAYPVRLTGMLQEDAEHMITQECHSRDVYLTPADIHRLFDRTGGVPLAIVWCAAQMGFGYPSETVLTRLGSPNGDVIRFCFDGSISLIRDTPAYKILFALALFRDGTSRDALGKVSNLAELDRDDGLVALEKLSLVNRESGRFKIASPLVELYIQALLAENGALENHLRERWISYLQEFINLKYQVKHNTIDEVIPELKNILDAIDWCRNNGRHEVVLYLMAKIDFYLWTSGSWNLRYDYLYHGLDAAVALNNDLVQANYCRKLSDILDLRGEWGQALKMAQAAFALLDRCGNEYGILLVLFRLGSLYYKQSEFKLAKDVSCKALEIAERIRDNKTLMRIESRLGLVYIEEGDFQTAKVHINRAVQIEQSLDEYQRKAWSSAWIYRTVGRLHLGEDRYAEAKENLEYSLILAQNINNPQEISETMSRLAELYFKLGHTEKANEMAISALDLFHLLGMKWHVERMEKLLRDISSTIHR